MQSQYTHSTHLSTNFFSRKAFVSVLKKLVYGFGIRNERKSSMKTIEKEKAPHGGRNFQLYRLEVIIHV